MSARTLPAAKSVEHPGRAHPDALGVLIGYPSSELRKVHDVATGETTPARSPFRFRDIAETKPLADPDALAGVLSTVAAKPHAALIRGAPITDVPRPCRRLLRPRGADPASVEDVPRSWLALDIDKAPAPRGLDFMRDPEATAAYLVDGYLPAPFLATSCVIQATGSAGIKPGVSCRLWFRLSRPITCGEAKRWLKPHTGVIDEAILQAVGIHYTATPRFIGRDDPMAWRVHVHESVFDEASVPAADEIAETAAEPRCGAAQRARWQSPAYPVAHGRDRPAGRLRGARGRAQPHPAPLGVSLRRGRRRRRARCRLRRGRARRRGDGERARRGGGTGDGPQRSRHGGRQHPRALRADRGDGVMTDSDNVVEMRGDAEARLQREEQRRLDEALGWMNERYAVVTDVGGKFFAAELGEGAGERIRLLTKAAFLERHPDQRFPIGKKDVRLTEAWWSWPQRRTLDRMEFWPGEKAPAHILNSWRGWAVEPDTGSPEELRERCGRWLRFVFDVIADGNPEHFRYILAWVADLFQNPAKRPGVALMLRGEQGTGKSFFAKLIRSLVAPHGWHAKRKEHVVGRFAEADHEQTLLLHCEEAFFARDPAIVGPLKSLITDETMTVERKGCGAYQARNYVRMIITTNEEVAVPAATDDRRFAVFDVPGTRQGDSDYFAALEVAWWGGEAAAFLGWVLQTDLPRKVNLRKIPDTAARREQKQGSAEPHVLWIQECLAERQIVGRVFQAGDTGAAEAPKGDIADVDEGEGEGDAASGWPSGKVAVRELFDAYCRWAKEERERGARLRELKDRKQFGKAIRPFFGKPGRVRIPRACDPVRGWSDFPAYEQVREAFERVTGLDVDEA